MNTFIRWGKFNLVGAMGIVVQLAALALFNRWMAGRYLYASAAAIEITLLHNFVWHWHYTWRDRRDGATPARSLMRFHLSSGLISMLGNLALMQLLIHEAHLPLLVSNLVAILCCSMANFCVGNNWAFAQVRKTGPPRESKIAGDPSVHYFTLALLLSPFTCATVHAQTPTPQQTSTSLPPFAPIPDAPGPRPTPPTAYQSDPSATYICHLGAFCGVGAGTPLGNQANGRLREIVFRMQKVVIRPEPMFMLVSASSAVSGGSLETQNYFASLVSCFINLVSDLPVQRLPEHVR
jgi:putative flippase GtrA